MGKRTIAVPGVDRYFEPPQKKARMDKVVTPIALEGVAEVETSREQIIVVQPTTSPYFYSTEARKLFGVSASNDVIAKIDLRIDRLYRANRDHAGWRDVVKGHDPFDACSAYDIFCLQKRSQYVALALQHAKGNMPGKTWLKCCEHSIHKMSEVGCHFVVTAETVRVWHHTFQSNGDRFPHPHPGVANGKDPDPPFFSENPDLKRAFIEHGNNNLESLKSEMMVDYVEEVLVPKLIVKHTDPVSKVVPTRAEVLTIYRLTTINPCTVSRWLNKFGFRYSSRKKHYFVDSHEKPENKVYRKAYCERYLQSEVRCHRWIQMTTERSLNEFENTGKVKCLSGYRYVDEETDIPMVEYHVDCCSEFQEEMNTATTFGGRLSVRMPQGVKALIKIGQDEAIQKQFSFNAKEWVGSNGQRSLVPKDEGLGIMISMYQSREFGIIQEISPINLAAINAYRAGASYQDQEAAIAVHGTALKAPIEAEKSPFLVYFEYGVAGRGYWNYFQTVCQLEDVTDCLKVLYPTYDFEGHFDHSSGHEKRSGAALDAADMNLSFGGAQRIMRDTIIEQAEGFLGNFDPLLNVGDVQRMVYQA